MPSNRKKTSKEKRKPYDDEDPEPPNPGEKGAEFLGWIKKRGFLRSFIECDEYCKSLDLDLDSFKTNMGPAHIIIARSRGGEKAVKVIDKAWASKWARKYEKDDPHHRHEKKL